MNGGKRGGAEAAPYGQALRIQQNNVKLCRGGALSPPVPDSAGAPGSSRPTEHRDRYRKDLCKTVAVLI